MISNQQTGSIMSKNNIVSLRLKDSAESIRDAILKYISVSDGAASCILTSWRPNHVLYKAMLRQVPGYMRLYSMIAAPEVVPNLGS